MSKDSKFLEPEYREPSVGARRIRGEIEWACEGELSAAAALGETGADRYIGQHICVVFSEFQRYSADINTVCGSLSASNDEFRWYRRKIILSYLLGQVFLFQKIFIKKGKMLWKKFPTKSI